ncbi:MAG: hypothetical protein M3P85_09825, partial [Actinomycetota bacterium]|nr:hypothetical protein [Actinomycetota bacterium]
LGAGPGASGGGDATGASAAGSQPTGPSTDQGAGRGGAGEPRDRDGTLAVRAERSTRGGSGARESGPLSALAVIVLALIVGATAAIGSRRSSR